MSIREDVVRAAQARISMTLGVSASEVVKLTGCSPTTALAAIKDIVSEYPYLMVKTSKRWTVINEKKIPRDWRNNISCIDSLSPKKALEAGILGEDIPVHRVRFTAKSLVADTAIMMAIRAYRFRMAGATHRGAIRIKYVGLRVNEDARWRTLVPTGLEEFGGRWRIIGIDVEKDAARTFQLSRIIDVEENLHPVPSTIKDTATYSPLRRYRVILDARLTPDQIISAGNELGLVNDSKQLTEGQLHDMMHQYGVEAPNDQIVWPLIERMEAF